MHFKKNYTSQTCYSWLSERLYRKSVLRPLFVLEM